MSELPKELQDYIESYMGPLSEEENAYAIELLQELLKDEKIKQSESKGKQG